jgi:hypothetical protein
MQGKSICPSKEENPDVKLGEVEAFYITGHSLGAAMGAIYTLLMRTESNYWQEFGDVFRGAYFFGQPMIGNPELAGKANEDPILKDVVRFINRADPIAHLPSQESGKFKNFGREFQFNERWEETPPKKQGGQMFRAAELLGATAADLIRQIPSLGWVKYPYQIDDHDPQHYIRALTDVGTMTEFGDYEYL